MLYDRNDILRILTSLRPELGKEKMTELLLNCKDYKLLLHKIKKVFAIKQ